MASTNARRGIAAKTGALCCAAALHGHAAAQVATVTITGRALVSASVAGFGDTPLNRAPLQASVIGNQQLLDAGIASIGGLTRLDASLSDAYNAEGYWSGIAARGYTLDNRFNYRRDGLPINAETAIALDNKDRLELFKGTSGIQAGTSAPGGLVNLIVKRPGAENASVVRIDATQPGTLLLAADLNRRFGTDQRVGVRLNVAHARLDPQQRHTRGQRALAALAVDWQPNPGTLLQAEFESSRQRQPSVAGFSMLGNDVPSADAIDPRLNLNDQPWRQPVVLAGNTASLRIKQRLTDSWSLTAHAMQQRLKSDDRTAFPYGYYDDPANYVCSQWCDRFAPDGRFTYWEFISNDERRTSNALAVSLDGRVRTAGVAHHLEAGVLLSRYRGRFQDQVFDIAGTGRIDGGLMTPPSAGFTDANTQRDERSTELFLRDATQLSERWQLWAGLRASRIDRAAERSSPAGGGDGLAVTRYTTNPTTPWLALAFALQPGRLVYASWGKGLETEVAPNRSRYANPGQSFALDSRQVEVGIKQVADDGEAALSLFDIDRGVTADVDSANVSGGAGCGSAPRCTRIVDGGQRHRGVEAHGSLQRGPWSWQASAMWLDAKRHSSRAAAADTRPLNVPRATLRLGTEYSVGALTGLVVQAGIVAESNRLADPNDQAVRIAGWSRADLGARWRQTLDDGAVLSWRVGVDNATDRRAWKESPNQFGHVYLYPLAPRTWRASVQAAF